MIVYCMIEWLRFFQINLRDKNWWQIFVVDIVHWTSFRLIIRKEKKRMTK